VALTLLTTGAQQRSRPHRRSHDHEHRDFLETVQVQQKDSVHGAAGEPPRDMSYFRPSEAQNACGDATALGVQSW
jgi:hypothetical protein